VCADGGRCEFGCDSPAAEGVRGSECDYRCLVPKAEGEACGGDFFPRFECAYPLFCDLATRSCAQPQPEGAPCTDISSCDSGLICARDVQACSKQREVGEPCSESVECVGYRCSADADDPGAAGAAGDGALGECLPAPRTNPASCAQPTSEPFPTPTVSGVTRVRG
jgi:hypothetical protein